MDTNFEPDEVDVEPVAEDEANYGAILLQDLGLSFSEVDFKAGIIEASYYAGMFSTLVTAGVKPSDAFSFISNKQVLANEMRIAELNAETLLKTGASNL